MFGDVAWEEKQRNNKKGRLQTANSTHRFPDRDSFSEAYFQKVAIQWHFQVTLASILDCTCLTIPPHPHSSHESVALFCHRILDNFYQLLSVLKVTEHFHFPWKFICDLFFRQSAPFFEQSVYYYKCHFISLMCWQILKRLDDKVILVFFVKNVSTMRNKITCH